jgi:hypothetical protein
MIKMLSALDGIGAGSQLFLLTYIVVQRIISLQDDILKLASNNFVVSSRQILASEYEQLGLIFLNDCCGGGINNTTEQKGGQ